MQNESNVFTDRRTLIAVVVIALFMFAWQAFMAKKYPAPTKNPNVATMSTTGTNAPTATTTAPEVTATAALKTTPEVALKPETTYSYENDKVRFVLSDRGMGLQEFVLKTYKNTDGKPIRLGYSPESTLFEIRLKSTNRPLHFQVVEKAPGQYEGIAQEGVMVIKRTLKFDSEKSSFSSQVSVTNASADLTQGLSILIPDKIHESGGGSFLFPSYDHQDFFVSHGGKNEVLNINHSKTDVTGSFKTASLVSVGNQYFTSALLDHSEIAPEVSVQSSISGKTALAEISYKPIQTSGELIFSQTLYSGAKSIDQLQAVDPNMASVVDFGMLAFIAKPLWWVMKTFHTMVGNWGLAIILLTLLVRFIVLPFNLMSFRSMKAMQKIQPLITELRSRYKDDPMTMNREMMALMKEHKANPIGGCLPMLLQMPVFFALFRVVGSSVELYQSPFAFWIKDLSLHDPFFVLPVLMGVTMFFQQKLTPSTMDPTQAKIMAFMPIIFTVFMLYLPSGLTLYMVVSAVFGIVQQWLVLRDSNKAPAPVRT